MAKDDIEIIDLADDDDPPRQHNGKSPTPVGNGYAITPRTKEITKHLWSLARGNFNGIKDKDSPEPGAIIVQNGCHSDNSVSSTQPTTENEKPTSTVSDTPTVETEELNVFDILTRTLSASATTTATNEQPTAVSSNGEPETSRKRSRQCNDNGEGESACCSKQLKSSNAEHQDAVAFSDIRSDLANRASLKLNAHRDCERIRRELEAKVNFWKEKYAEYWEMHTKLREEMNALGAKLDSASPVERRTIGVQVGERVVPVQEVVIVDAGPSATKPKPTTPATQTAPPARAMPNLKRYPSPANAAPGTPSIRSPAATVAAVLQTPPSRASSGPTSTSTPSGGLPPRLPMTVPVRTTAASQAPRTGSKSTDHITIVSSTGTRYVLAPSGGATHQPNAKAPPVAVLPAAPRPPSGNILTSLLAPNHSVSTPRPNGAPSASEFPRAVVPSQHSTPPRLVRAPAVQGAVRAPAAMAPGAVADGRVVIRGTFPRPNFSLRPAIPASRPSAAVRPVASTQPRPQAIRPAPDPNAARSPQSARPLGFPPLPVLKTHVSANDLNAASAAMRPLPPKPALKVSKDDDGRVTLCWDMPSLSHVAVKEYRLYSYKEDSPESWRIVGGVDPMDLPMACTLTSCVRGNKYYFTLSAQDVYGRFGPFSDVCNIRV